MSRRIEVWSGICDHHCEVAEKEGIPTKLDLFLDHCKQKYETGWINEYYSTVKHEFCEIVCLRNFIVRT